MSEDIAEICTILARIIKPDWRLSNVEENRAGVIKEKTIWSFAVATAAAKSLQLCPTLCDPIDGSPPGSSIHGIF